MDNGQWRPRFLPLRAAFYRRLSIRFHPLYDSTIRASTEIEGRIFCDRFFVYMGLAYGTAANAPGLFSWIDQVAHQAVPLQDRRNGTHGTSHMVIVFSPVNRTLNVEQLMLADRLKTAPCVRQRKRLENIRCSA